LANKKGTKSGDDKSTSLSPKRNAQSINVYITSSKTTMELKCRTNSRNLNIPSITTVWAVLHFKKSLRIYRKFCRL